MSKLLRINSLPPLLSPFFFCPSELSAASLFPESSIGICKLLSSQSDALSTTVEVSTIVIVGCHFHRCCPKVSLLSPLSTSYTTDMLAKGHIGAVDGKPLLIVSLFHDTKPLAKLDISTHYSDAGCLQVKIRI
jgi:hypothetical protein